MRRLLSAALVLPLLAMPSSSQEKKKREPDPLMLQKLKESQTLLEGLALNDLAKVQASAEELLRISKAAQFRKALNTAKYEYHANNFQRPPRRRSRRPRPRTSTVPRWPTWT